MLTERRRRRTDGGRHPGQLDRRADEPNRSNYRMLHLPYHVARRKPAIVGHPDDVAEAAPLIVVADGEHEVAVGRAELSYGTMEGCRFPILSGADPRTCRR